MIIRRNNSLPVYIMIGLPGSGKSTWIENNLPQSTPVVSRDIIRAELGFCNEGDKVVLSKEQEQVVSREELKQAKYYIEKKIPFVIDDTNLSKYSESFIKNLKKYGKIELIGVKLNTPLWKCKQRRESQIPAEVLDRLNENLGNLNLGIYDKLIEID